MTSEWPFWGLGKIVVRQGRTLPSRTWRTSSMCQRADNEAVWLCRLYCLAQPHRLHPRENTELLHFQKQGEGHTLLIETIFVRGRKGSNRAARNLLSLRLDQLKDDGVHVSMQKTKGS